MTLVQLDDLGTNSLELQQQSSKSGLIVFDRIQRDTLSVVESTYILVGLTPNPSTATPAAVTWIQTTPALEWIIPHNLGYEPIVSILSPGGQRMFGAEDHLSVNVLKLSFVLPTAGRARLL